MKVWIGWDPREALGYEALKFSMLRRASKPATIRPLKLNELRSLGLYRREHEIRDGRIWDVISEAPCSTEFSISRFLVPLLEPNDWALFVDCDMLCVGDLAELFALRDDRYAVMCVKHVHEPPEGAKMDNQLQTLYARKNWSSCVLFNGSHPANRRLTHHDVNTRPGRDLHRFCWLQDHEIGELPPEWNFLVGTTRPKRLPRLLHFTDGLPMMDGYGDCDWSDAWRDEVQMLHASGYLRAA